MYWVYVLKSSKDERLYTGVTADSERRVREHNAGRVRSTGRDGRSPSSTRKASPPERKRWPGSVTSRQRKAAHSSSGLFPSSGVNGPHQAAVILQLAPGGGIA
ncbi:MAG TPA: GIY-YIG nuclease family protein [Dehalococcoidia bacterium]|nr:GIY-YIG nuclease family protein [Dehalococcoidia bacterium]